MTSVDAVHRQTAARGTLSPLLAMTLAILAGTLGIAVANIALPAIAADLAVTTSSTTWVVSSYLVAMTAATLVAGRLGDMWGDSRVLTGGLTLLAAGSLGAVFATSLPLLIAARAVQGTGAAVALVLAIAVAKRIAPEGKTGKVLGLLGSTSALAQVAGPSLGGLLVEVWSWRAIFVLLTVVACGAAGIAWRLAPGPAAHGARPRSKPLDTRAASLFALSIASAVTAITSVATLPWLAVAILGGVAMATGVWAWRADASAQARGRAAVIPRGLMGAPGFSVTLAMNALVCGAMMAMLVVPPYFLIGAELSAMEAGAIMAVGPALGVATGWLAGRLVDSWGARPVRMAGTALVALGCAGIAVAVPVWSWWGLLVPMTLLTPGFQAFMASNTALAMQAAGEDRGAGSGALTLSRNVGQALATALLTAIMATLVHVGGIRIGSPTVMLVCFGAAALMAGIALLLPVLARRRRFLAPQQVVM
ncbi:MFS transporter [Demequina sp. B12]|uniref:MFS transporter n=1 Tax=Demequina sp. B12 TaxID=2992757 RepID=UPI00237C46E8|nr:MFS transporter [Demequina sp. B12]MDE0572753.1 MFS transporter [Demequina sp. B12]